MPSGNHLMLRHDLVNRTEIDQIMQNAIQCIRPDDIADFGHKRRHAERNKWRATPAHLFDGAWMVIEKTHRRQLVR